MSEPMKPSAEAVQAGFDAWNKGKHLSLLHARIAMTLQAAYAIDFAAQRTAMEALREALKEAEFGEDGESSCPNCMHYKYEGHAAGCSLAAALAGER